MREIYVLTATSVENMTVMTVCSHFLGIRGLVREKSQTHGGFLPTHVFSFFLFSISVTPYPYSSFRIRRCHHSCGGSVCQTPLAASLVSDNKCRLSLDSSFFPSMIYLIYDGYTHIFLCTMSRRISLPWRFFITCCFEVGI